MYFLLAGLSAILLLSGFTVFRLITLKSPDHEVNLAREGLALAKNVNADKYANEKLTSAEQLFNDAINEWRTQNDKLFIFRNFSKTIELANSSLKYSIDARKYADKEKNDIEIRLEKELKNAGVKLIQFEKNLKELPLDREIFDNYNNAKMKYLEAENNYKSGDFQKGFMLAILANEKATQAVASSMLSLENYFENYSVWKKNADYAVQLSGSGKVVVLVNKMESEVTILKSGKAVKIFKAEFSPNWLGDKIMRGDRKTPEGIYKVVEMKKGKQTKYHKALLLDYPNQEDRTRFENLIKSGDLEKNAQIGGLIEIHGGGGKGIHWTDGCIALTNKDMDMVFDLCKVNTAVIIVGSEKKFEEYFN